MFFVPNRKKGRLPSNTSPQEVVLTQEKPFLLNKNVSITYPEGNLLLKRNAEFLSGYIRQATGYTPPVKGLKDGETAKHAINLGLDAI